MRAMKLLVPVLLLLTYQPAEAQRARVVGVVVDSATGSPLSGVQVRLLELDISTVTDSDGSFQFFGVASGEYTIAARQLAYEPVALRFRLNAAERRQANVGRIRLSSAPVELDPIVVEAEMVAEYPQLEGFFQRRRSEQGTFFTEAEIQKEAWQETSDVLRKVPGFRTNEFGQITSARGSGGFNTNCAAQIYVNGVKVNAPSINVVQPATIVAMEIYGGSSTVPNIYRSQSNASCGVIAIWTRHTRR